ncbi:MAG: hypothetical protein ACM3N5_07560, partial [Candidatus Eiseniibacteriota bacterium]
LPELTDKQVDRAAIALAAFGTPSAWRWLVDITGCSEAEAEHIASWAIAALAQAVERDPSGLDGPTPRSSSNGLSRKKGKQP